MRTLMIILVACSTANAQAVRVMTESQDCRASDCRLVRSYGTGVVIGSTDRQTYVLTAAHVVASGGTIRIQGTQPARVVAADRQADVALLEVSGAYSGDVATIGTAQAQAEVRIIGCGQTAARFDGRLTSPEWVDVGVRDGDSGGPVYVGESLNLVGLVIGIDAATHMTTHIVPAVTLTSFCRRHCPQYCRPSEAQTPAPIVSNDIPDREKTARIALLESRLAVLDGVIARLKTQAGEQGPIGPQGRQGVPGPAGRDAVQKPLTITLNTLDTSGKVVATVTKTYQPGDVVELNFRPIESK